MTPTQQRTVQIAVESLHQILASMPPCDDEELTVMALGVTEVLMEKLVDGTPTKSEAGLVALLAVALVRIKELERL